MFGMKKRVLAKTAGTTQSSWLTAMVMRPLGMKPPTHGATQTPETKPSSTLSPQRPLSLTESDWSSLVDSLVEDGLVTRKEVAETVLGAINPPQAATAVASKAVYQEQYPPRKTWQAVKEWLYDQGGRCIDCGTKVNLEIDHAIPRKEGGLDRLDNLGLRCRRHNSSRRHANGGKTELTTQAALMYVMMTNRPKTYKEFEQQCRAYGLTCSNIRFQEAWAQAVWLKREKNG